MVGFIVSSRSPRYGLTRYLALERIHLNTPEPIGSESTRPAPVSREVRGRYRREFMQGLATAAAVGATAALLPAQGTAPPAASVANDIRLLNYALTLEFLEAAFYTQGLSRFGPADFQASSFYRALQTASGVSATPPASGESDTGLVQDIYAYLSLIRNHEQAHVRTLISTIRSSR